MRYRQLGKTGVTVSEFCIGTGIFGIQVHEADGIKLIKTALASGVNFVDTANSYSEGTAEGIVGKALKGDRQSVVLATKVGQSWRKNPAINEAGLSRKTIMRCIEESLRRLQTDYLDLYYLHEPDQETPLDETLRALDDLIHQGKVRYIGCSNYRAWQVCKGLWLSQVNNLARFDCVQPPYNLLTRDVEYELFTLCASEGVGICVYNPLAGGFLTGKYKMNQQLPEGTRFSLDWLGPVYHDRYWSESNFKAMEKFRQVAENHGISLAQLAIAWVLSNAAISAAICGQTSIEQLDTNIKAVDISLSKEELAACDNAYKELIPKRYLYGR